MFEVEGQVRERFLVELTPTATSQVEEIGHDARAAARRLRQEGISVRFLRTIVVPEDGRCYLLWEADSREALVQALESVGWETVRSTEAISAKPARKRGD